MSTPVYLFSLSSHPDAISVNSLDIKFFHPQVNFTHYDYFIITSKQTIKALKKYDSAEYIQKRALIVSKKSAQAFEKVGGKILDIGEGYGADLVQKIQNHPKETRWLYLRAKEVASDFVKRCKDDGYNIDELILYESLCSQEILNIKVEQNASLIFTSPSSVECFLKNNVISQQNRVVVIGTTTAKALPKGIKYIISQETSIQSCIDAL